MELTRWNNTDPNPGPRPQTSVFRGNKGLDVASKNRASGEARRMFLTSPYIDQALALKTILDGVNDSAYNFLKIHRTLRLNPAMAADRL